MSMSQHYTLVYRENSLLNIYFYRINDNNNFKKGFLYLLPHWAT